MQQSGIGVGLKGMIMRRILNRLRDWDRTTAARVQYFVANSDYIRERISRCYGRDATVIYPPVDVDFFTPDTMAPPPAQRDYYVTASRWVPYKRIDAIVAAFKALPDRRLIVVGDGPEAPRVRAAAGANVEFSRRSAEGASCASCCAVHVHSCSPPTRTSAFSPSKPRPAARR